MQPKKAPEANIEKKKYAFFYIGLAVALTITLIALEWTSNTSQEASADLVPLELEMAMGGDVLVVAPIPPKPTPNKNLAPTQKKKDEKKKEEGKTKFTQKQPPKEINFPEELFIVDPDDDELPVIDPLAGTITKTVTSIDKRPYFPSCCKGEYSPLCYDCTVDAIFEHLHNEIKVPECVKKGGGKQLVWAKLTINQFGKVDEVEIINLDEVCPESASETIRALKKLPEMVPGEYAGVKVKVSYHIPIRLNFM